jgi:hypothetical protein
MGPGEHPEPTAGKADAEIPQAEKTMGPGEHPEATAGKPDAEIPQAETTMGPGEHPEPNVSTEASSEQVARPTTREERIVADASERARAKSEADLAEATGTSTVDELRERLRQRLDDLSRVEGGKTGIGVDDVLRDIQTGTDNKLQGGVFQLRDALTEVENGNLTRLEDMLDGKQGFDGRLANGDIVQWKDFANRSALRQEILRQADSDFTRYSERQWLDGGGGQLSGNFEFRFNADRIMQNSSNPPTDLESWSRKVEAALNQQANDRGFNLPNGQKPRYRIIPKYGND